MTIFDTKILKVGNTILKAVSTNNLEDLKVNFDDYDVIGIDEGQFFPDLVNFCEKMANAGKAVIVAALDGTFQRKGFPTVMELIPLAEHVVKLNAVCMVCFGEGCSVLPTFDCFGNFEVLDHFGSFLIILNHFGTC